MIKRSHVFCLTKSFALGLLLADAIAGQDVKVFGISMKQLAMSKEVVFGASALDFDVPEWKLERLVLGMADSQHVKRQLMRHAQEKIERLEHLYGLEASQIDKLTTAAQYDAAVFLRTLDRYSLLQDGTRGRSFARSEFFGENSMMSKVLKTIVSAPQLERRERVLNDERSQWLIRASRQNLFNWIAFNVRISPGQLARLKGMVNVGPDSARKAIEEFKLMDRQDIEAILTEEQMAEFFEVLTSFDGCGP